jgi:hypothetical protein
VLTEAVIPLPVAEVAGYAADPANAPRWYANIAAVEWETAPPVEVGSRRTPAHQCCSIGTCPTSRRRI